MLQTGSARNKKKRKQNDGANETSLGWDKKRQKSEKNNKTKARIFLPKLWTLGDDMKNKNRAHSPMTKGKKEGKDVVIINKKEVWLIVVHQQERVWSIQWDVHNNIHRNEQWSCFQGIFFRIKLWDGVNWDVAFCMLVILPNNFTAENSTLRVSLGNKKFNQFRVHCKHVVPTLENSSRLNCRLVSFEV